MWLDTGRGVDVAPERRRCGYVFQDYALFGHLSAWQNVAYGLRELAARRAPRAARTRCSTASASPTRADARPADAVGRRAPARRASRARWRASPAALLLDEPLSALDAAHRARAAARELAAVLRDAGVPALLVTHDFAEAALLGDRVGVLDRGRVVQRGTAGELAARARVGVRGRLHRRGRAHRHRARRRRTG